MVKTKFNADVDQRVTRKSFRNSLFVASLVIVTFLEPAFTAIAVPPSWPPSKAVTLSGKQIVVPRGLGSVSILVVGFTKRSREQTDSWSRRLRADDRVTRKAIVYDVIVFDSVPSFVRSLVLRQVMSGMPNERRERFLVVTQQIATWRDILEVREEDLAYIALVESNGNVRWRSQGSVTDAVFNDLLIRLR